MGIRGGDIAQFKWFGREFDPYPEASFELTLSGIDIEHKPSGNGTIHPQGKRVLAGIDGAEFSTDHSRGDLEFLNDHKSAGDSGPLSITLIDGTVYSGSMANEGELKFSAGDGKISTAFRGPRLEQI